MSFLVGSPSTVEGIKYNLSCYVQQVTPERLKEVAQALSSASRLVSTAMPFAIENINYKTLFTKMTCKTLLKL